MKYYKWHDDGVTNSGVYIAALDGEGRAVLAYGTDPGLAPKLDYKGSPWQMISAQQFDALARTYAGVLKTWQRKGAKAKSAGGITADAVPMDEFATDTQGNETSDTVAPAVRDCWIALYKLFLSHYKPAPGKSESESVNVALLAMPRQDHALFKALAQHPAMRTAGCEAEVLRTLRQ